MPFRPQLQPLIQRRFVGGASRKPSSQRVSLWPLIAITVLGSGSYYLLVNQRVASNPAPKAIHSRG
jgi:hypothetical protein